MKTEKAKVLVLGAGPGGYAAAFYAADLGMEVTLVDDGASPGGVCLNRGCIPSKTLLHLARLVDDTRAAGEFGMQFGAPQMDLAKLREWRTAVADRLTSGIADMAKTRKVKWVKGRGRFGGPNSLLVEAPDGEQVDYRFESAIVATGSLPAAPPGLAGSASRIWDSTTALALPEIPRKLLVVGGGYIGLELGSVYAALGSAVTVVEMTAGLLPGADPDLVRPLAQRLAGKFEAILLSSKVTKLEETAASVRVTIEGAEGSPAAREFDRVLVAVGRKPNTRDLGLERAGVTLTGAGFIRTDKQCRTSMPGIFAIGDAAGQPMLAHKAAHEARVAVEVATNRNSTFEPKAIPAVVFTDPEVAWCGLTETQAKASGIAYKSVRFPWSASGRAMSLGRTEGVTKLIVEPETERILGVGITGYGAGELISEGVLAIEAGLTASNLAKTIHPHPTLSETLMEAAEVFLGFSTHFYRPKR